MKKYKTLQKQVFAIYGINTSPKLATDKVFKHGGIDDPGLVARVLDGDFLTSHSQEDNILSIGHRILLQNFSVKWIQYAIILRCQSPCVLDGTITSP